MAPEIARDMVSKGARVVSLGDVTWDTALFGAVAAVGATYREIIDFSNLDGSVATNAPGQSGRPGSPFYGSLTQNWANAEYFPLSWSRETVEANAAYRLTLRGGD